MKSFICTSCPVTWKSIFGVSDWNEKYLDLSRDYFLFTFLHSLPISTVVRKLTGSRVAITWLFVNFSDCALLEPVLEKGTWSPRCI